MGSITWNDDNTITITPSENNRKITGTRFGAVLGYNPWKSEFNAWCEMTNTYKEPFVDNKYTIAGKTIEPIIDEYLRNSYYMKNLYKPEDIYSASSEEMIKRDFFLDNELFGGMWDALLLKDDKTYPSICITNEYFPKIFKTRKTIKSTTICCIRFVRLSAVIM